jgi:hypothetical protein
MSDPLDRLGARVAEDPFFLAAALHAYQRRHGLSDFALAAELHCDPSALAGLRLCRRPVPEGARFDADLADIAGKFGCDRAALRRRREADMASEYGRTCRLSRRAVGDERRQRVAVPAAWQRASTRTTRCGAPRV